MVPVGIPASAIDLKWICGYMTTVLFTSKSSFYFLIWLFLPVNWFYLLLILLIQPENMFCLLPKAPCTSYSGYLSLKTSPSTHCPAS